MLVPLARQAYNLPMKTFLYIVAAVTFVGPIAAWAYLVGLAGAFSTNSSNRGVRLEDYWDTEFLTLAALPWLICIVSLIFASRMQ